MVCLNVKTRLIHDSSQPLPDGGDLTLGELLRRKGAEGVHVIGLASDDKTSHSNPFFETISICLSNISVAHYQEMKTSLNVLLLGG
jgi:hypothetical protein